MCCEEVALPLPASAIQGSFPFWLATWTPFPGACAVLYDYTTQLSSLRSSDLGVQTERQTAVVALPLFLCGLFICFILFTASVAVQPCSGDITTGGWCPSGVLPVWSPVMW
jgi:hypothetical protein